MARTPDVPAYAGRTRVRFTVFGSGERLADLAADLARMGDNDQILRRIDQAVDREGKLRVVASAIDTWSKIMMRLLEERVLDSEPRRLKILELPAGDE